MSRYHDDSAQASDPISIETDVNLLARFRKLLGFRDRLSARFRSPVGLLAEHMRLGDSRAAVVVAVQPEIRVAAYTDEIDCVVVLKFPRWVNEICSVEIGSRLLTVNTYWDLSLGFASDITAGEAFLGRYGNYYPIIAEFVATNRDVIELRKRQISEREWERTSYLADVYEGRFGPMTRDGNPYRSHLPGSGSE